MRLGGTSEVAELLGCPPQQLYSLRHRQDFPKPLVKLKATPVWDLDEIAAFKLTWKRRGK